MLKLTKELYNKAMQSTLVVYHSRISCGICEIGGLSNLDEVRFGDLIQLGWAMFRTFHPYNNQYLPYIGQRAYVTFSHTTNDQSHPKFARYIEELGLGKVEVVGPHLNPNSRNKILIYIWFVDLQAFYEWYKTQILESQEREKEKK